MDVPKWKDRAEFEAWWKAHGDEFRRLSVRTPPEGYETVTDPEYLRIIALIEAFNEAHPPP
jgi:hypothetical protein